MSRSILYRKFDSEREWAYSDKIKLVWTDPPFGTGKEQAQGANAYQDVSAERAVDLTVHALSRVYESTTSDAVMCVCADDRIIHQLVMRLDFLYHQGDVIWTFGLGRPRTNWWPRRHNTIATFTVSEKLPVFDKSAIPRELRKAPKAGYENDKPAGSVWDYTMSNTDPERVGYPNQKPMAIIDPFILAHTQPGDIVADPFMGSGSVAHAAKRLKRGFRGQDLNPQAIKVTKKRLA